MDLQKHLGIKQGHYIVNGVKLIVKKKVLNGGKALQTSKGEN